MFSPRAAEPWCQEAARLTWPSHGQTVCLGQASSSSAPAFPAVKCREQQRPHSFARRVRAQARSGKSRDLVKICSLLAINLLPMFLQPCRQFSFLRLPVAGLLGKCSGVLSLPAQVQHWVLSPLGKSQERHPGNLFEEGALLPGPWVWEQPPSASGFSY